MLTMKPYNCTSMSIVASSPRNSAYAFFVPLTYVWMIIRSISGPVIHLASMF